LNRSNLEKLDLMFVLVSEIQLSYHSLLLIFSTFPTTWFFVLSYRCHRCIPWIRIHSDCPWE
jgi:hypothetical protein